MAQPFHHHLRAPSTARLYGASQQCARPAHAPTCRPLVGRAICSHVHIPTTENKDNLSLFSESHAPSRQLGDLRRAQPTVYRKGRKICALFRASCDRAATGRPAASEKVDNLSTFTAGTEVRPTEVKLTSLSPFGGARDLTSFTCPLFTCPLFTCPYTENKVKLTLFSGHHATARQLSATTVACVAQLRMRYRVRCGVCACAARASPLRYTHLSFRHRRFELSR
jgi:hypothetical protein